MRRRGGHGMKLVGRRDGRELLWDLALSGFRQVATKAREASMEL